MKLRSAVQQILRSHCRDSEPGASAGVMVDGELVVAQSIGQCDVEKGTPATSGTNYRLASVSKQFTATAVLLLVRDQVLHIDDSIAELLPGLPLWCAPITVRHLLNHTSGLPDYEPLIPAGTVTALSDADVVALVSAQRQPMFAPGVAFHYSNGGYAFLAAIVESSAGIPFQDFLRRRIFGPAGMDHSLAHVEGDSSLTNRAFGYSEARPGSFVRTDQSLTSAVLGDGGVYSSVDDLARWERALLNSDLFSDAMKTLAWSDPVPTGKKGEGYGFGWFTGTFSGEPTLFHSGDTIGFRTCLERFPRLRMAVSLLMNRTEADVHAIARQIAAAAMSR